MALEILSPALILLLAAVLIGMFKCRARTAVVLVAPLLTRVNGTPAPCSASRPLPGVQHDLPSVIAPRL